MSETKDISDSQKFRVKEAGGEQKTALQAALTDEKKSALQKYQEVALGTSSLFALIRYELLTLLIGSLPGALGLALRKMFSSLFLARLDAT
ncbi:hypothetical protein HC928_25100 [bacterium]|nr:hypothetical protein [bacterium]